MQLQMVLSPADVIAALTAYLAAQTPPHQMNATVAPVIYPDGGAMVLVNN